MKGGYLKNNQEHLDDEMVRDFFQLNTTVLNLLRKYFVAFVVYCSPLSFKELVSPVTRTDTQKKKTYPESKIYRMTPRDHISLLVVIFP